MRVDPPVAGGWRRIHAVATTLTIGDFSRMTHLSVKTLRHYHPDRAARTRARRPRTTVTAITRPIKCPTAQVIRRFRDLDMPIDSVPAPCSPRPTSASRNTLIAEHLDQLQAATGGDGVGGDIAAATSSNQPEKARHQVELRPVQATPAHPSRSAATIEPRRGSRPGGRGCVRRRSMRRPSAPTRSKTRRTGWRPVRNGAVRRRSG